MAKKNALLEGYKRVTGSSARMETPTGEIISQRQYRKIVREKSGLTPTIDGKKVISNEALAKLNRETNREAQLARPARGRTGLSKETKEQKAAIAAKRKLEREKAEKEYAEAVAEQKLTKARNKRIAQVSNKKAKKFSLNSLRAGRIGFQSDFYDYGEFQTLIKDARKSNKVFGFAIGIRGIDERNGKSLTATLTGLYDISYPISEEYLIEITEDFISGHAYFVFLNGFVHFSFKKEYAIGKAERAGVKLGYRKKSKPKTRK